jgi:hypothetical protein
MFHWKIIIALIIIKILSLIIAQFYSTKSNTSHTYYQYKLEQAEAEAENRVCVTPAMRDFMMSCVKYAIDMCNYSESIIKKYPNEQIYYNNLEKTKNNMISLFFEINNEKGDIFEDLINEQISIKINLCNSVVNNNQNLTTQYSQDLKTNTEKLGNLFIELKKNKQEKSNLKIAMNSHTETYIKSVGLMKKATNTELDRELILGSIESAKLLFV